MDPQLFIWLLLLLAFFLPALQRRWLMIRRLMAIRRIEKEHGTRVITLIHRQESLALLGLPLIRYIDIEDAEQVLRAIHLTGDNVPIQVVMHTPGGLVLSARQIAHALKAHTAKVQVVVPYLAMSGGTLIALAADEIVMDSNAVLGPVDPQVRSGTSQYAAASVLRALEVPNPNREDQTLIMGDVAGKAIEQLVTAVEGLLSDKMPAEEASRVARLLAQGTWTHDYPLCIDDLRKLGLNVDETIPVEFHQLMKLYPQPGRRPASVEFIPEPYDRRPGKSEG